MTSLTIFTPTYNRAYCLHNCYESLCRQTSKDFCWLVIDDGSTDNTRSLVAGWIKEAKIAINYIYQENQGMHGAHNAAYKNIITEYNVCIDSDDYMPNNAVEIILSNLKGLESRFAGLIGLDADASGNILGTEMPVHLDESTYSELHQKYKIKGDKKLVYRTEIVKSYPEYPLFKGERFVPLDYLYILVDQAYKLKPVNKVFVIVDYRPDGSTNTICRSYMMNPRGFAFSRICRIDFALTFKEKLKNAIHLVSSAIFAKDMNLIKHIKNPAFILIAIPLGVLLNIYVRIKVSYRNI